MDMPLTSRTERLDIRISPAAKRLLLGAAKLRHKSLSEFVLDTALTEAENTLAEKRLYTLGEGAWGAFVQALDAPPRTHPRMQRLLTEKSVFD
jgi:uncharacterized protein (DUF1778 family)